MPYRVAKLKIGESAALKMLAGLIPSAESRGDSSERSRQKLRGRFQGVAAVRDALLR